MFGAFHHMNEHNDLLANTSNWNVTNGSVYMGKCHTYQYPNTLEADMVTDGLLFALNPNTSYRVFFHDPKYYLLVSNPMVYPRIWFEYKVILSSWNKRCQIMLISFRVTARIRTHLSGITSV